MKSYIKNFKSVWIALVVIIAIELFVFTLSYKDSTKEIKSYDQIFTSSFFDKDSYSIYIESRISYFLFKDQKKINFIQIGDSSGLYSLKPKIVQKYIDNSQYLNFSCCSSQGWDGHVALAKYYTKRYADNEPFYLVFYFNLFSLPGWHWNKQLPKTLETLSSWRSSFYQDIPSLFYRNGTLNRISLVKNTHGYDYKTLSKVGKMSLDDNNFPPTIDAEEIRDRANFNHYIKFKKAHLGWVPYFEKPERKKDMPVGNSCKHMGDVRILYKGKKVLKNYLEKIHHVTKENGGKLIVIVNPVACKDGDNQSKFLIDQFEEFRNENPDVIIPFDFITTWHEDNFSDQWHLNPEAAIKNSHRIGKALKGSIELKEIGNREKG